MSRPSTRSLGTQRHAVPPIQVLPAARTRPFMKSVVRPSAEVADNARRHRGAIIDAELLRLAIDREQKRVDRSNKAFALLTVALPGGSDQTMKNVAEIVGAATRAGDLIGWLRQGEALGVLLADTHELTAMQAVAIENRIRGALTARATDSGLSTVSVRLEAHSNARRTVLPATAASRRSGLNDRLKRLLDVGGSGALLAVLSPLLLLVAAAVKLTSRGPILFRQERVGQGMAPFIMLKFRTMHPDAGHAVHQAYVTQFIQGSVNTAAGPGVFKLTNDSRITPIGQFLRKSSLDELPQLWNVLRGEMSLVGPRPPIKYEVEQYKAWHRRRVLDVKPGLTGLWQVTGRSRTTFDEMVRLDLRYARTCSVWTDVKILLATPRAVIAGKGAC
jgi:lipopolysaccharide/colanic/teichoic acid biosynthesis glycosyltransferase